MTWPLLFFSCTLILFIIPLLPALIEWYRGSDAKPLQVVRAYDGDIRYFAVRFRQLLDDNLPGLTQGKLAAETPSQGNLGRDTYQLVPPGSQPVFGTLEKMGQTSKQMVLGIGSLQLPENFFFEREVYAFGRIECGRRSSFRVILAEDEIRLADDCDVVRWAHSNTRISVGRMSRLYGRISAEEQIRLDRDTRFVRMHAPQIYFGVASDLSGSDTFRPPLSPNPLAAPDTLLDNTEERWLVGGSLDVPAGTLHAGSLVAKGDLSIAEGSCIQGSLSGPRLQLAANVHVRGAIVADGDIHIGPGCRIAGPIVSEGKVTIAAGSCIGTLDVPTTITAHEIRIEEGVLAHGSVWARELGFVAPRQHS